MNKDSIQLLQNRFNSKQKNGVIGMNDLKQILLFSTKGISQQDFMYIFEDLTRSKHQFSFQQFLELFLTVDHQCKKVFNRLQPPTGIFLFQSFLTITQLQQNYNYNSVILDHSTIINSQAINVNNNFNNILSNDYEKKLINIGANGLINEKQEQKIGKYFYNHWVQGGDIDFLNLEIQKVEVQLIKAIWSFNFPRALNIANSIYQQVQQEQSQNFVSNTLTEVSALLPGLQNLNEIVLMLNKCPLLKQCFQSRSKFQIDLKQDFFRKNHLVNPQEIIQIQDYFNEVMQLYSFTQQYFQMIQTQLTNSYYKFIASFLANSKDDRQKSQEEIQDFVKLQSIGIIQRFLYAKKFFNSQNFDFFKKLIKVKSEKVNNLEYILLFGNRKQSQKILQNYLDQFNDIQKVAEISVYLKTFSEQSKITTIREQKSAYSKFIQVYEWLLDKQDGGISRLIFDKKCLSIQIQRKRKNLTKTFTFDCSNCKSPQIYSVLSKKINIDSKQPKLKGYHYFAKDSRSQIMYCIECMQLLPRCSICLYPISVFNAYAQQMKKNMAQRVVKNQGEPINKALVWCPQCKHGGHFQHIQEWFKQNRKCPVVNCKCKCTL